MWVEIQQRKYANKEYSAWLLGMSLYQKEKKFGLLKAY